MQLSEDVLRDFIVNYRHDFATSLIKNVSPKYSSLLHRTWQAIIYFAEINLHEVTRVLQEINL